MGCFVSEEGKNKNVNNLEELGKALEFNNEVILMFST